MTKYVVTNGKGEYLWRDQPEDLDFGADQKHATQFNDFEYAHDMARIGNLFNILGDAPDRKTNPFKVVEVGNAENS